MKKITVIFSVLVLCCISAVAKKEIDKAFFDHLLDYANYQYLIAFIEKNDAEKSYIKDTYEKSVKPELLKATLNNLNDAPNYNKIESLFPDGSNDVALQLAGKINKRKNKYNKALDDNSLSVQKIIKNQTIQTSSQVNKLEVDIKKLQQQNSTLWLLIIICLVVIILLITTLFLWYKLQFTVNRNSLVRKFVEDVFFLSEGIKEKFNNLRSPIISDSNNNVRMFEDKLNKLERQFGELSEKVRNGIQQQAPQQANNTPQSDNALYFASKSDKQLTEQLPSKTNASFRVFAVNSNEAKFEYIGVVKNENWFEGICSIENDAKDNLTDKKQINTTQPGNVKKDNNNWVIIIPAKIKFV
ncbi:MAG: hypothetical protein LBU37_03545 [Tannerellaceae bacterium]|jgi:hypothetical protein|nr:hypothetical protein [Tannerellaceae bacterium]